AGRSPVGARRAIKRSAAASASAAASPTTCIRLMDWFTLPPYGTTASHPEQRHLRRDECVARMCTLLHPSRRQLQMHTLPLGEDEAMPLAPPLPACGERWSERHGMRVYPSLRNGRQPT